VRLLLRGFVSSSRAFVSAASSCWHHYLSSAMMHVLLSMFASAAKQVLSFSQKEIHEQRHNEQRANSYIEQTNDTTTML